MRISLSGTANTSSSLVSQVAAALGAGEPDSADALVFTSWSELAAADPEALRGKKIACLLSELPFEPLQDPAFRFAWDRAALWITGTPEGEEQLRLLHRPVLLWPSSEPAAALHLALQAAPVFVPSELRVPAAEAPESLWHRGRRALGLGAPKHDGLTVSIFREFVKPPYGGANQFMLALKKSFEAKGVRVLVNEVSERIDGYYFDSLWFDEALLAKLERLHRPVVVHRIDGPIHLYRGKDKDIDDRIFAVNGRLATSTVIQSHFTLRKVFETGYKPVRPVVIRNATDSGIFHPPSQRAPLGGRKLRIIATSWSDNPNKGGPIYKWLEENLDWNRYEFTFVGRCSETLSRARVVAPVPSERLAELLGEHDIYLTASQNDPCSNALIEAMSCGLPALALKSGGHPELVGAGGLCFERAEEIPAALGQLAGQLEEFRARLRPPRMEDVAARYLELVRNP